MKLMSNLSVGFVGLVSLAFFTWPLFINSADLAQQGLAQTAFMILMPILVGLLLIEFSSGSIDSRQLAILGVLVALSSVIRLLGAGTSGIETIFFIILVGAYVFGSGFGYLLGATAMAVSALLSGGVGPWLPFQMMAAGLLGLLAGAMPKSNSKKLQLLVLSLVAIIGSFIYGSLMTLWNWPFLAGIGGPLGYHPAAGPIENLSHFIAYEVITGGLLWDTGRAVTTVILIWLTAPALLTTLKRAARRAGVEIPKY